MTTPFCARCGLTEHLCLCKTGFLKAAEGDERKHDAFQRFYKTLKERVEQIGEDWAADNAARAFYWSQELITDVLPCLRLELKTDVQRKAHYDKLCSCGREKQHILDDYCLRCEDKENVR